MDSLSNHWREIAQEAVWVQSHIPVSDTIRPTDWEEISVVDPIAEQWVRGWTGKQNWLNYGIIYKGMWLPHALKHCPYTVTILRAVAKNYPIIIAGYSWLRPKSGIPTHVDTNPGCTTVHLGLSVPSERCVLITNNTVYCHKNGGLIYFDSNQPHSAVNATESDRLILYLLVAGLDIAENGA